jgi:hypothetical protein
MPYSLGKEDITANISAGEYLIGALHIKIVCGRTLNNFIIILVLKWCLASCMKDLCWT